MTPPTAAQLAAEYDARRRIDVRIADDVMKWRRAETFLDAYPRHYTKREWPEHHQETPRFSNDIAAAWQVVERLREMRLGEAEMKQVFSLAHCYPAGVVAQAICRAALLAVGDSSVPTSVVPAVDRSRFSPDAPAVAPPSVPSRDAGGADR